MKTKENLCMPIQNLLMEATKQEDEEVVFLGEVEDVVDWGINIETWSIIYLESHAIDVTNMVTMLRIS
ncbi:unnamed protein product [Cochlearia groenlandica]